ncbi:Heterokaryon incompatibility protein 6, OR allele [Fusarium sp. LHS14.1]|nr:Heterokaryon incompatibility protein 6, OR allele [Fusarium sp. LHS14.1]
MNASVRQSIYKHLDPARKEIRLLGILPVPPNDRVYASCRLSTVSLIDQPNFKALSYVWGDASVKETILLNNKEVQVGKNLAEALKRLTEAAQAAHLIGTTYQLWADAVCINQDDELERSQQVLLMGELYSSATFVCAWLGTQSWISTAFKTLRTISRIVLDAKENIEALDGLGWLYGHPEFCSQDMPSDEQTLIPNRHWMALRDLVDLPYWSRMWIFQEIVLSKPKRLTFMGATDGRMYAYELNRALGYIDVLAKSLIGRPKPDCVSTDMWRYLQRLQILGSSARQVRGLLYAKERLERTAVSDERAALCLLSAFDRNARASDVRDYYYSLLGVAQMPLQPDYSSDKRVQQVCLDFVQAYLDATRNSCWALLFLHDAVGPGDARRHGLPSWAPCYHLGMEGRVHHRDAKASSDDGVFCDSSNIVDGLPTLELPTSRLRVLGAKIMAISFVSYRPTIDYMRTGAMGACLLDFVRRHGPDYVTGVPAAAAFFATHRRQINGNYDHVKYLTLVESLAAEVSGSADVDDETTKLWRQIQRSFGTYTQPTVSSYHGWIMDTVRNEWVRALASETGRLVETREGYIGLAPLETEPDDVVCVLQGFQYPVLLRPSSNQHIFIGACFMLGLMTGEAKTFLEDGRASPEVFELK